MPRRVKPHESAAYIWGIKGAASYLGISEDTFKRWRTDPTIPANQRELLTPRIIRGTAGFKKETLVRFMSPALNADGAVTFNPFSSS